MRKLMFFSLVVLAFSCEDLDPKSYPNLKVQTLREGVGDRVVGAGDTVHVHYRGMFEGGKVFDSSYKRGKPKRTNTRSSTLIKGWKVGMMGMKKGEKRRLIIPPELGFGEKGKLNKIPPNATLVFEVELVRID